MAILTVQKPALAGAVLAKQAAAAGGDSFPNSGVEFVNVTNTHATDPRTLTFDAPGICSLGLAADPVHDSVVVVTALTTRTIGPFPVRQFNDANGRVQITYSDAAANISIAVQSPG